MVGFAFSACQDSNTRNKLEDCSIKASSKSKTPSKQILLEEIKAVVFEKDELVYQDMTTRIAFLTFLANVRLKFDTMNTFRDTYSIVGLTKKAIDRQFDHRKRKHAELKENEFEYPNMSRLKAPSGTSGPLGFHLIG